MPDYVGYGTSKDVPHAYSHISSTITAALDMMRATKEFCAGNAVALKDQVFLSGWSQGGAATLGMAREIEQKHASEFNLIASAPYAGPYQYSVMASNIFAANQDFDYMNTYAWVLLTYNRLYNINRPSSYYFKGDNGPRLESDLLSRTPLNPRQLLAESFLSNYLNGVDTKMINAFKDNDTDNWKPSRPITFYHGDADNYAPYYNAVNTVNNMKALGSTSVKLVTLPGKDHSPGLVDYIPAVLTEWQQF